MKRRAIFLVPFLATGLGVGHVAAQSVSAKVKHIGVLGAMGSTSAPSAKAFEEELRRLGFSEGQNVKLHTREYTTVRTDALQALAMELVRLNVDVILVVGGPAAMAAKQVAGAVPIVFFAVNDPVGFGLVANLARPEANVTGTSFDVTPGIYGKQLELLKTVVPRISRLAVLWDPSSPGAGAYYATILNAAKALGVSVQSHQVSNAKDFDNAFAAMTRDRADSLQVLGGGVNFVSRDRIIGFATQSTIPAMYQWSFFVDAGGLMAYTPDIVEMSRRAGAQVARILNGAKPADIPVEQPARFELVVNAKTLKALGLSLPAAVQLQVDRMVE